MKMRTFARISIVLVATLLVSATFAYGDLRDVEGTAPSFTPAETKVIARNELLASIVKEQPLLVRRALDALAVANRQRQIGAPTGPSRDSRLPKAPDGRPSRNPDLERMDRASPEALNDLFQLLKQAGAHRPK
jgi:hypothetical protein